MNRPECERLAALEAAREEEAEARLEEMAWSQHRGIGPICAARLGL